MKLYALFVLALAITINVFSQGDFKDMDKILSRAYKQLRESNPLSTTDSLARLFKIQLIQYISVPATLNNNPDSLQELITIRRSPDGKIKFYSYEVPTGGTWHEINVFVQYAVPDNRISYQLLNIENKMEPSGFGDSEIYEVNEIREEEKIYYVTFGRGTHGSGNQHQAILVFRIDGDRLVQWPAFQNNTTEFVIEYPRREQLNLAFDKKTNTISFGEFTGNNQGSPAQKTGKRKILRFLNGSFL